MGFPVWPTKQINIKNIRNVSLTFEIGHIYNYYKEFFLIYIKDNFILYVIIKNVNYYDGRYK